MKKYKWRLLLAALFLVFLGFPPAVLTRVQVSFSDSSYEKAENLKILTSRSDETIPFSGLQTTYGKKGESRNAVRYYAEAGHNLPPDIRDDSVSPAIGTYGTTRLAEKTPYYFYAGKLFSLFPGEHMERLFGLCLGIGLVLFVLYQLACETSMLNRLIRKGAEKRDVGRILLLGLLFGHVLTAKANYYVILIYAFFMLLVPFLEEDRRGKLRLLRTYAWIVLAAFAFLGLRLLVDFIHYGFDKDAVVMQLREARAVDGLRPQDPPEEQAWSFMMYRKEIPFREFLTQYGLFGSLFRSAAEVYGGSSVPLFFCVRDSAAVGDVGHGQKRQDTVLVQKEKERSEG